MVWVEAEMKGDRNVVDRIYMLDVWMALGGTPRDFEVWVAEQGADADAWSHLVGAVRGDHMASDHNPPVGDLLLILILQREAATQ